jgi:peptide/nickel transport system permease protein
MIGAAAGRIVQIAVTLLVVSFVGFSLIGLMPGDPIDVAIAGDPRLGPEDAARLRAAFGLDRPLTERWWAWLSRALSGEFGHSRLFARPVAEILWPALLSSIQLLGIALAIAALGGVAMGVAAARRGGAVDGAVSAVSLLGQSVPTFWLGILMIIAFAVELGWLPAGGADSAAALVMPVATLAVANLAAYARHMRAAMLAVLPLPYVRTARAKGASERRTAWRHALPNAAVPAITLIALDAGALVSGALITEAVFARPGMGKLIYDATMGNDFNLALLALMVVALLTMLATWAADVALALLDPRLRQA